MLACPCCGYNTLEERNMYEICPICFWEDDGSDNNSLDEDTSGPNHMTLREARSNYFLYKSISQRTADYTRLPTLSEVKLRYFNNLGEEE